MKSTGAAGAAVGWFSDISVIFYPERYRLSAFSLNSASNHHPATSNQQPPYGSRFHRAAIILPSSPGTQTTTAFAPDGPVLCRTESGTLT